MVARSKSSQRWLKEHFSDEYVKRARADHFRSRAVYKLKEIDERDGLIKPGYRVVDLGAAPGGWSQYTRQKVGKKGRVLALDILDFEPLPGVEFIRGDFTEDAVLEDLQGLLGERRVDLILSDMAPNQSGIDAVDQPKSVYLAELALDMAHHSLAAGGAFLVKVFQGAGFDDYYRNVRTAFAKVVVRKPQASRPRSREVYLLAKGFKN